MALKAALRRARMTYDPCKKVRETEALERGCLKLLKTLQPGRSQLTPGIAGQAVQPGHQGPDSPLTIRLKSSGKQIRIHI